MFAVTVFGGLGAPGHTLPTAHAGIYLAREGVPLYSPGEIQARRLRRTTYVASPGRQGQTDYSIEFDVCEDVRGWFGHVTSLSDAFPAALDWSNCVTYSTADETVQTCFSSRTIRLTAGQLLGTAGMSAALGYLGFDFGLEDRRVNNFYVARWRFPETTFHAVCPWEHFDEANRAVLFSKLRNPGPSDMPSFGEPRCGTMAVDVEGTAQGVWAELGVTSPVAGDERRYVTLANHPYWPTSRLALSLGPTSLGAMVGTTGGRQTSGRVNRAFDQIGPDGLVYCYDSVLPFRTISWFVSLGSDGRLRMARVNHSPGAGPCGADPSTWSLGPNPVVLER
jgi:hypothetical protein